jgi:hypothetical protein
MNPLKIEGNYESPKNYKISDFFNKINTFTI